MDSYGSMMIYIYYIYGFVCIYMLGKPPFCCSSNWLSLSSPFTGESPPSCSRFSKVVAMMRPTCPRAFPWLALCREKSSLIND